MDKKSFSDIIRKVIKRKGSGKWELSRGGSIETARF
jgi:predicted CopG family antitoxin